MTAPRPPRSERPAPNAPIHITDRQSGRLVAIVIGPDAAELLTRESRSRFVLSAPGAPLAALG